MTRFKNFEMYRAATPNIGTFDYTWFDPIHFFAMTRLQPALLVVILSISVFEAKAEIAFQHVEMKADRSLNYYVTSEIEGAGQKTLLVDTGSGYSTISQDTLKRLQENGEVAFLRKMEGIMADGSRQWVSVYRIAGLNIGGNCYIKDVEVAVFPTGGREILGLSALGKVSPFTFSIEPPRLTLSNCNQI